jgi:hypothetical protein
MFVDHIMMFHCLCVFSAVNDGDSI